MADLPTSIEMNVPADQVDSTVASVCAEWGVDQADVEVDVQRNGPDGGTVRLLITLHGTGHSDEALEDMAPEDLPAEDDDAAYEEDDDQDEDEADEPEAPAAGAPLTAGTAEPGLEAARGTLVDLLERMNVRAEVDAVWGETDTLTGERAIVLDVRGDDLGMLIGRKGETLAALQYITRLILSKQSGEGVDVVVDVQGHKRRREEQIRRMARRMAEQAAQRQRTMTLEPMPANERRIVHIELRDHPDVRTESVGEGHSRKVTIIPK
jgi:spoIIIJ-associated protein